MLPPPAHPAIDAVLAAAATLLGMEVVFIGGLSEDTFTFSRIRASRPWPGLEEGQSIDRTDSLCHRLLSGGPASTSDAAAEPAYADSPETTRLGVRSYVGVPVRDPGGRAVATLCGIDRGEVEVNEATVRVLAQLAEVVGAHLETSQGSGVVIRRSRDGGWEVAEHQTPDLISAMVLADLLAEELTPGPRPPRMDTPLDEVAQLRLSVRQLEHALAARVVVEQAIGVLTERQRSTPRDAFERLRKVARSRGRRVHELAREVVGSASDPAVPLPPELAGRR